MCIDQWEVFMTVIDWLCVAYTTLNHLEAFDIHTGSLIQNNRAFRED